jgi:hypothetical protein
MTSNTSDDNSKAVKTIPEVTTSSSGSFIGCQDKSVTHTCIDNRNQQIQLILHHISRIETELAILRQLIGHLASNNEEGDQDLILVDAELVIPEETVAPSEQVPQEPRAIVLGGPRTLTRSQILQDARWRAQNWAIRE